MIINIKKCAEEILDVGHCILRSHFPKSSLDEFHAGFMPLLDEVAARVPDGNRGTQRWAIGLPFAPPFYQKAFFVDDSVNRIIESVLGKNPYINYFGTDTPVNGSEYQRTHADLPLLFDKMDIPHPPVLLSVRFVSVDMTLENGPFEAAEGTQNLPRHKAAQKVESGEIPLKPLMLKAGDVLITDPRTLHRGTPNRTDAPRPFAVIVYLRHWYQHKGINNAGKLEANENTPRLMESFYDSLSHGEQTLLRNVPRTAG